ncbi:MAG TPA: UDP-2,3-diacylglucosamine diphosphatase, partial [Burkholderiales bacterium]|nr:UDP-2,3-diacylglucosamine diphosphatase [Burkholderiales bacterium]
SVMRAIRDRGLDGVICGHIHSAELRDIDGLTYMNCGDWVDSCTAIVEHHDGRMELINWIGEAADADDDLSESETAITSAKV